MSPAAGDVSSEKTPPPRLPPNHHAEYRSFSGFFGYLAGLMMTVRRRGDARLVVDMADLRPGQHLVDIGCGPGTAVRLAAIDGLRSTGVDPSPPMLRIAAALTRLRRPPGTISWHEAGAEDLLMPTASVDVAWSLASVHHWPELDGGISEVRRVLKPGGLFIALERRSPPSASGGASHGWTSQQAELFATMLINHGFTTADVANHDLGRRRVVTVAGRLAG